MNAKMFLVVLLAGIGTSAFGQTSGTQPDPIDVRYGACLALPQSSTTEGQVDCTYQAAVDWNAEVEQLYAQLRKRVAPEVRVSLENAQRTWLASVASEMVLAENVYEKELQGAMWQMALADRRYELVKQRALALRQYLADLSSR